MGVVPPQILAIDLGTSGMKAALVAVDGTITGWAERAGTAAGAGRWWRRAGSAGMVGGPRSRSSPTLAGPIPTSCARSPRSAPPPRARGRSPSTPPASRLTQCISWLDMRGAANLRRQFGGFPSLRRASSVASDRPLAAPHRRDAVGDRQGPGRAHAAGARRDAARSTSGPRRSSTSWTGSTSSSPAVRSRPSTRS